MFTIKGIKSKKFSRYCNSGTPLSKKTVALNIYKGCILGGGLVGACCGVKNALNENDVLSSDPYYIVSSVMVGSIFGMCVGICSPILIPLSPFLMGGQLRIEITKTETITKTE